MHAALKAQMTRRQVVAGTAGLVGLSLFASGAYATAVEPKGLIVTRYAMAPRGWPVGANSR